MTAYLRGQVFLALNGVPVSVVDVDQAEARVMSVAGGAVSEVAEIARELRKLYL